jgi:hypothetical protein
VIWSTCTLAGVHSITDFWVKRIELIITVTFEPRCCIRIAITPYNYYLYCIIQLLLIQVERHIIKCCCAPFMRIKRGKCMPHGLCGSALCTGVHESCMPYACCHLEKFLLISYASDNSKRRNCRKASKRASCAIYCNAGVTQTALSDSEGALGSCCD